MIRRKKGKKISFKKIGKQETVIKNRSTCKGYFICLKRANETLAKLDLTDFINNPHKYVLTSQ
ncbi:hypothetical protein A4H97_00955 [Niastella yeongjuensis]|uniref:Uncharacterized protein n=1 Tax=Niastella yeongjuensis TaxID=354355 RepID=A0A1V9EWD0_9BACT|nr:hypothetical protein [Niastella yeongjuensis]OQP50441.1 hypothetical protein A4H97_00955 [Niastella yeongjuensis]SEN34329.1 hypothetical protein SAMN05660816_00757 [Niastella yeongjuensis]